MIRSTPRGGRSLLACASVLLGAPLGFALQQAPEAAGEPVQASVSRELASWNAANSGSWHTYGDVQTGYAQFLFGGNAPAVFEPTTDEDYEQLGRLAIEATEAMHGIELGTLVHERFTYLPLGLIGTTDKATVRFRQEVGGVPVLGAYVNTLFDTQGRLLSVQTTAMPGVAGLSTQPSLSAKRAVELALAAFEETVGLPGRLIADPKLAIAQHETSPKSREARLVWVIEARWEADGVVPEAYSIQIDARDGSVLREDTLIHHFDVGGTLSTLASAGNLPDQGNNPAQALPMNYATVNGGAAGTVVTDANGNFNFPGVTGPLNITVNYQGSYASVTNQSGAAYSMQASVNGTGNSVVMNSPANGLVTAQANSFRGIGQLRDWVRSVNPTDNTADFTATSNCNINSTCNAYYDGVSVNFYTAGGGCPNTAYSGVIAHEMGHWLNVRYGTGNGSDGMGEGNADVFAMYLYNTSEMGEDFLGPNTGGLRTGNNTLAFCGDSSPGCYGAVHTDGQPWMGAAWKIYDELRTAYGAASADSISDALFLGWMNSYNQTQIRSVIETQWLTLEDNNGNIDDGTPHYQAIDTGFRRQSFPGFDLSVMLIQNVTVQGDTQDELGPYNIDANISSLVGSSIIAADVMYSVNGAGYVPAPMAFLGGDLWTASIPGQPSPATVSYYVRAQDALGNVLTSPMEAPAETIIFHVGIFQQLYFDDFELGENGWTHASFGDTSNNQDDWQRGLPNGQAGDPGVANSGLFVWGNDLAPSGFNGAYQSNVHSYLRSPVIDCSSAVGATLRFKRWLTVEEGIYDQARISVNGVVVWSNPLNGNLIDTSWTTQEVDISSVADGNSAVQVEFSLQTDGGLEFGGWTIDDVEVIFVAPVGGVCTTPVKYGAGKINSQGIAAEIAWTGVPSISAQNFAVTMDLGTPGQPALLFSGSAAASVPAFGGTRLVANPITREGVVTLNLLGAASKPYAVPPGSSGSTRYFQFWYRDPSHPDGTGVGLTDGLQVIFCD